jgi:hypothetical protein
VLTLNIKLAVPLTLSDNQQSENAIPTASSQILPMFVVAKCKLAASKLSKFIYSVNGRAFKLEEEESMFHKLTSIRITEEDATKNVIGGFEIIDCDYSVFYIEGYEETIRDFERVVEMNYSDSCKCIRLDRFKSANRIRPLVSPTLLHIYIDPSVQQICKWTSTYLQKNINSDCYKCLNMLLNLTNACFSDSLKPSFVSPPTQGMIFSLLKSYGKVLTLKESIHRAVAPKTLAETVQAIESHQHITVPILEQTQKETKFNSRISTAKVGSYNPSARQMLIQKYREPNFVKINAQVCFINQRNYTYYLQYEASTQHQVYNYSIQKNSSTAKQLESLKKVASKVFKTH